MLDVGAGDGWFAGELGREAERRHRVLGHNTGAPTSPQICPPASCAPQPSRTTFDIVLLLDVEVEHVEDDGGFLDQSIVTWTRTAC